jgi:hypothetical protein
MEAGLIKILMQKKEQIPALIKHQIGVLGNESLIYLEASKGLTIEI